MSLRVRRRSRPPAIAIVGAAVRLPGASTLQEFQQLLHASGSRARPMPEARVRRLAEAGLPLPSRAVRGGYFEDIEGFDPERFGILEAEARMLDPQQRLFLDAAWEAMERAGSRPDRPRGTRGGVYVGITSNDFAQWSSRAGVEVDPARIGGNLISFTASRVAYLMDLSGPALVIDAACASSLLAVHLAMQALRSGEIDLGIAGGANVLLHSEPTEIFDRAGVMSEDARARAYDDAAAGYFRSEGAVALVLKRLPDAVAAGDPILAVLRGSAAAQDGRRRAGLLAPGVDGQRHVAALALRDAGVEPETIALLEAQGTSTTLGDALELTGLSAAYAGRIGGCALGSIKTRIGHLEAAAGAASLLSAVLAVAEDQIPPSGRVETPSRLSAIEETPFYLADRGRRFPAGRPRRAAVHAHGMGGTNVHLILEAAPPLRQKKHKKKQKFELFTLSARSPEELDADVDAVLLAIAEGKPGSLVDWCAAAAELRRPEKHRVAILAKNLDQLADRLHLFRLGKDRPELISSGIYRRGDGERLLADLPRLGARGAALLRQALRGRLAERQIFPALPEAPEDQGEKRKAALSRLAQAFLLGAELNPEAFGPRRAPVPFPPAPRRPRPIWPKVGVRGQPPAQRKLPEPSPPPEPLAPPPPAPIIQLAPAPPLLKAVPAPEPEPPLLELLIDCLQAAALRPLEVVDPDRSFLELGADSVTLTRFASLVEDALGLLIPRAMAFEQPTLRACADWLAPRVERPASDWRRALRPSAAPPTTEAFALTPLQQAYLGAARIGGALGGRSCQVFAELEIDGVLDFSRLQAALASLMKRHPMLGVGMSDDGRQRYLGPAPALERLDLGGFEAVRARLLHTGADLRQGPMIRAAVLPKAGSFCLLLAVDLIVADLESVRIIVEEWRHLYQHPEAPLPALGLSFDRYLELASAAQGAQRRSRDRDYWMSRIESMPLAPALPMVRAPESVLEPHFGAKRALLPSPKWARLSARAKEERLTVSALIAAAFAEVLAERSGGQPFCLNLPVFDRRPLHPDVDRLVGPFSTNVLVECGGAPSEILERARSFQTSLDQALEHKSFSGVEVARAIAQKRRSQAAIAPVVFTAPLYGRPFEPWGRAIDVRSQTPQVWLDCQVIETAEGLSLRWDYVEELFEPELIDTMFRSFVGALRTLAEAGVTALDGPEVALRRAAMQPIEASTLDEILRARALVSPHARAVVMGDRALSYRELDELANRVANGLLRHGVEPKDRVAILCGRGIEQIALVVGVLRANAAYVPVDPSQPDARVQQILEDARPAAIVTDAHSAGRARGALLLEPLLSFPDARPPAARVGPEDLAYVIFTSGSTGRPKGTMIAHQAALNTLVDINQRFDLCPFDRVLGFSSLGFDLSVWDLFGTFLAGATLVILEGEALRSPSRWWELISQEGVTVWNSVPTGMKMLVDFFEGRQTSAATNLRLVMLSGDWIPVSLPDRISSLFPGTKVISLGGATEASIWSCIYPIEAVDPSWTSIPYGRALRRQSFHVLDDGQRPVPAGEVGELYIGGAGVALGYLGDEAKTKERFVPGPLGLGRLYRTGDLGRFTDRGDMEFLGRRDLQVKIRGFRVEISEVETALALHPAVADSAVAARGAPGTEKELIAHYVPRSKVETQELLSFLRARLPDYMVPQHFVEHERLPLNDNGKIDRSRL
ncbi:MAG: amino acid adenylation domain-containing protein [Myxococcota bacterium]